MADSKVPYVTAYGSITKALDGIKRASTPDRFTQDFLASKLGLKGGSPKPVIPFLKRTGFLNSDGSPTDIYKRFRNNAESGRAAAQAMRGGFSALYEINEYVHDVPDDELRGIVVQATGTEDGSVVQKAIMGSFKALRPYAVFDSGDDGDVADYYEPDDDSDVGAAGSEVTGDGIEGDRLRIGYTINLNLPATSDVAVFNAIFKSLREHLLR